MDASLLTRPRFLRNQKVSFIGGCGTVQGFQAEAGSWSYLIEMELGPEPSIGRIGNETKILLPEADIIN